MPLQVYSTLTRKKEPFQTVEPGKVRMYVCGPTVYKPSHVGHMVGPVIFDTVKRYLSDALDALAPVLGPLRADRTTDIELVTTREAR